MKNREVLFINVAIEDIVESKGNYCGKCVTVNCVFGIGI